MSYLRTFVLLKEEGSNGAGESKLIGVGAVMPSGSVVLEWANGTGGVAVFPSVEAVLTAQHDRGGAVIRWGSWDDE
jgi:hypothetical protein